MYVLTNRCMFLITCKYFFEYDYTGKLIMTLLLKELSGSDGLVDNGIESGREAVGFGGRERERKRRR